MRVPDIHVDELHLRPWQPDDAEAMFRACQDPVLHRWEQTLPWPFRREDADRFIAKATGTGSALHLGIFDRAGLAGGLALHQLDEKAGTASLGYWSAAAARGRRVTERAARALLRRAFDEGLTRIDWRAAAGNHPSRLTALRLGFTMIGTLPGPDRWLMALTPGKLTAAGTDVAHPVRMTARAFFSAQPALDAGPVTLRKTQERDIPEVVTAFRDPEVIRWFGAPQPYTEEHARHYVDVKVVDRWTSGREAVFAIADDSDTWAGSADVRILDDPAVGELGYLVSPRARGHGYAVSAVRALSRWAFEGLGLERLQIRWENGNDISGVVAQRAGYTTEGLVRQALVINGKRRDFWMASLLRDEVT
ncbi:GNAT family N-acetyltransferase [Actinoplanes sp. NPDC051494]|uniref:GNAT family N-acetyltransferase n=1 Tax=Actinoplanes sp. NPDC051494 TaxID=3363907 RepID=UPI0037B01F47